MYIWQTYIEELLFLLSLCFFVLRANGLVDFRFRQELAVSVMFFCGTLFYEPHYQYRRYYLTGHNSHLDKMRLRNAGRMKLH